MVGTLKIYKLNLLSSMKKLFVITFILLVGVTLKGFSQTVYSSAKGEKYHTADCKFSGDANPIKIAEAKKSGKAACEMCKPNDLGKTKLTQCSGKTVDKKRCKRMTSNKNAKCFQHQPAM